MGKYYSLVRSEEKSEADIYIFDDIVTEGWKWADSEQSGYSVAREIRELDVKVIRVHINSYGGHVSEGLAIHNVLLEHPAKIKTICDGFACSAASVVFMAGDERVMNAASLLMIHNAWNIVSGEASELRKAADDLEIINEATKKAYLRGINISESELTKLMDESTWILPEDAVDMGFATQIATDPVSSKAAASVRKIVFDMISGQSKPTPEDCPAPEEETEEKVVPEETTLSEETEDENAEEPVAPAEEAAAINEGFSSVPEPAKNKLIHLFAAFEAEKGR